METGSKPTQAHSGDKTVAQTLALLQALFDDYHPRDFTVRLWDGSQWPAETESSRFTLILRHAGALRRMFKNPSSDLALGEAYIFDDFDLEGDIEAAFQAADHLFNLGLGPGERLKLIWLLWHLPAGRQARPSTGRSAAKLSGESHSLARDRQAVTHQINVQHPMMAAEFLIEMSSSGRL